MLKSGCEQRDEEYDQDFKMEPEEDTFADDQDKELCPEDFQTAIKRFKNELVAVEFECAGCCKKAIGILKCIGEDYILLARPVGKLVLVEMFCRGMADPVVECAREAVIRFKKIISAELVGTEDCPS